MNALVMSKLVYAMNVLDVPDRVLKEVERMVNEFVWGGKGVRIAGEVMENEYEDGGLKYIMYGRCFLGKQLIIVVGVERVECIWN